LASILSSALRRAARLGALVLQRLDAGDGAAHLAHPARLLELVGRRLEAQVELLALQLASWSQLVVGRTDRSSRGHGLVGLNQGFAKAGDHLDLDGQLLRRALESGLGERAGNAVELEQDAAGLDPGDPEFGLPLPEPMRTSAGLLDTGTSGKMRIHKRP
jgi:hypothetical protein